ncbi:hypothetical protein NHH03_06800 [Stieleria sp. TO1_6]|uniref:hypothetical protein n=1 Tax=Stieleria tagensis TaxID=2956795 RepID=UPI00209ADE07|nr:hypothetical protein [Stieleria tagensis]MCO8121439.1 hypothetical protein [Stieleria tagensis]
MNRSENVPPNPADAVRKSESQTPEAENPLGSDAPVTETPATDAPFVAKLVDTDASGPTGDEVSAEAEIRSGSPFRIDPPNLVEPELPDTAAADAIGAPYGDFGPFLYTAMGASTAAVIVLLFAALGTWWFPIGGALVAALGIVLSIIGLFSPRRFRYAAIATLAIHMTLFCFSYVRSMA